MKHAMSRRNFLKNASLGVAAASVAGAGVALAEEAPSYEPVEVIEADVVVVGSGTSGLAATVQAAELGARDILP